MRNNGAQHIDPFTDTELSMQADQDVAPALDAHSVEKPDSSLVRAQRGATSLFPVSKFPLSKIPVSKTESTLEALRPTVQSLVDAHRPLGFLLQQGIIAFAPLASLLGVEFARPASQARKGGNDAGE